MKLKKVEIEGYRSIRERLDLFVDNQVTVVLGANDHGKSNVLNALLHLNPDRPFEPDDLNWDLQDRADDLPKLVGVLELSDDDKTEVTAQVTIASKEQRAGQAWTARREELADLRAEIARASTASEQGESATSEQPTDDELLERERALAREVDLLRLKAHRYRAERSGEDPGVEAAIVVARSKAAEYEECASTAQEEVATTAQALEAAAADHGSGTAPHNKARRAHDLANKELRRAEEALDRERDTLSWLDRVADEVDAMPDWALDINADVIPPIPDSVRFERSGVSNEMKLSDEFWDTLLGEYDFSAVLAKLLPRVELIRPQERLSDAVTVATLNNDQNEFMRGIFRYAGLQEREWESLFRQDDRTTMRLDRASNELNSTLREAWSQGRELEFTLDHRDKAIHLLIKDPAVEGRYVRASKRSSGFTHFFATKTVLHAREQASGARTFLWLFDEPGIYLHPEGQFDLMRVIESLGVANQVVYSTHSIFLVNKNYPTRHRLIRKSIRGTEIDHKPFVGRWQSAMEALGLSMPGSMLFASRVLLVEGDSDPILLLADLQRLSATGEFRGDLNDLAIVPTGEARNTDALLRLLRESPHGPRVALLVDGDQGGNDRRAFVEKLAEKHGVAIHQLPGETTIEDHVLYPEAYRQAAVAYIGDLADTLDDDRARAETEMNAAYTSLKVVEKTVPNGTAAWFRQTGQQVLGLRSPPSSVGPARLYVNRVTNDPPSKADGLRRARTLAGEIDRMLELSDRFAEADTVIENTGLSE